jgi:3-deoxy-manno-octulosonate cytidylyltransferase (CMP-KDO synthetase)
VVATDDARIRACVEGFGGRVIMTSAHHASGTDRVAEAAAAMPHDVVVNVQGDEPLIEGETIDRLVQCLLDHPEDEMATLATSLSGAQEYRDPSVVKVVRSLDGRALYFSRSPVPFLRGGSGEPPEVAFKHVGLYAYRRRFLVDMASWPPSPLELCESLEQLRALEHGATIRVELKPRSTLAVDTPEDVARVEHALRTTCTTTPALGGEA